MLKETVKRLLPGLLDNALLNFKNNYLGGHANKSYSQEGKDLILHRLFEHKTDGFYVDVGAHHPVRFSNTYLFYRKGWRGINIDAMHGSMKAFNRTRKRDINLEIPVSDRRETLTYYMFNEPALNGFSSELTRERDGRGDYRLIAQQDITTATLEEILDKHLPDGQEIDFLSVDVEGLDLQALKSSNWEKYRPAYVLAEILNSTLETLTASDIHAVLAKAGYTPYAKTVHTVVFKRLDI
ncbi:MAG: FkbM family methyltransferase [Gammaproteobacteria bacterium]|nr:FkbM family methyltransferase [Gammaproteobacteria bacterium]